MTYTLGSLVAALCLVAATGLRADEGEDEVLCAQEVGDALLPCPAVVERDGAKAVVVVEFPSGFKRRLIFEDGAFLRGNATMSGVGTDMEWRLDGATYRVRVDDQRFEIPEALVSVDQLPGVSLWIVPSSTAV